MLLTPCSVGTRAAHLLPKLMDNGMLGQYFQLGSLTVFLSRVRTRMFPYHMLVKESGGVGGGREGGRGCQWLYIASGVILVNSRHWAGHSSYLVDGGEAGRGGMGWGGGEGGRPDTRQTCLSSA